MKITSVAYRHSATSVANETAEFSVSLLAQIKGHLKEVEALRDSYSALRVVVIAGRRAAAWTLVSAVVWPLYLFYGMQICFLPGMDRIGQQVCFIDAYLRQVAAGARENGSVIFVYRNGANSELDTMLRRYVTAITNPVVAYLVEWAAPWLSLRLMVPNPFQAYGAREFMTMPTVLRMDASDKTRGRAALECIGIGPTDWFATFHARDTAYIDLNYHDYRNGSIDNCMLAAEHIAACGGWALRLGAAVESALPEPRHPRIIDYASEFRTDFLDVYLTAKNVFHLGNSSGISALPIVFGRPCGMANMVPLGCFGPGRHTLWMPKTLREIETGRVLSFGEAYSRGLFGLDASLFRAETYADLGLEFVENSAEDILELAKDLFDMVENKPVDPEAERLQELYRERFLSHLPEYRHSAPLAPSFVLRHRELIEA